LLSIYLGFPEEASSVKNILDLDELDNTFVKKIFSLLFEKKAEPTFDSISIVLAPEEQPLLTRLMIEHSLDVENVEENVQWYVFSIKKRNIALALNELARQIEIAGSSGDNDSVTRLQKEQHELLAKKQQIDKLRPSQN
ncbi:MAG: hypothetical protein HQK90_16505, partial [Nitrospirae bacterium]|nr:hypothetical protein [Nitrospirota bacterium]